MKLADVEAIFDRVARREGTVLESGQKRVGVLELKDQSRLLPEPGGQVQANPLEQQAIVPARFVSLDREAVVVLESKADLTAEGKGHRAGVRVRDAR